MNNEFNLKNRSIKSEEKYQYKRIDLIHLSMQHIILKQQTTFLRQMSRVSYVTP